MKPLPQQRGVVIAVSVVAAIFALVPFAASAATLYVDAVASGTQDGSQSSPYRTIKQALDVAASGDTIHVAAGTYSPSSNGEQFPIIMKDGVVVEGEGPQTTILNAEGSARVVLFISITNGATAIKKFVIAGGNADRGGGIYCDFSSGVISNNFICCNSVSNAGAGIECRTSNPTIQNNVIWNNSAGDEGGGIDCDVQSAPTIVNNTIVDNHNDGDKGGVNCDDGSSPLLINNIIHHNDGYGVFEEKTDCDPILKYNDLYDNRAHEYFDCTLGDLGTDMDTAAEINGLDSNTGNMVKNPRYVNQAAADFRLWLYSPCIDAGTNESAPSDDVLGRARPYDVWAIDQNGSTTNYDIGAFEYEQNLIAPSGSFSPTHIILTQTLSLSATVTNAGDDTASPTQMQFYLCRSKSIASGTSYLLVTLNVPELARDASYTAATSLALNGVPAGTYYVGWLVDSSNAVHEWDEANEFFASDTLTVDAVDRDLAISAGSFSPAEIRLGETLWVNAWVENVGNWDTESTSVLEFYLSDDAAIERDKDLLLASEVVPDLAPGASSYYLISAQIDDVAPRQYYVGWIVDALDQVSEGDEYNEYLAAGLLLVTASYRFDSNAEGWASHDAPLVFEPPIASFTTGSLALQSLTNTNTFGYWQSPAHGIRIIPNSLYLAEFSVSSDLTDRSSVPTVRVRANTADAQIAHDLRIDSTGAGDLSPSTTPALYDLYFPSPSTLIGSAETTVTLSFDLLNFDPSDATNAVVRLEEATLTRFLLDDLGVPTDVRSYEFNFSAEDWTFTSVPSVFSAPLASIADGCLVLQSLTNTDTFGCWATPTDDVVIDSTPRLFRTTFSVRSDQADRAKAPTLRLRSYDSQNQMTVEQTISSVGNGANSPSTSNSDYALYFLTRTEMDQRGLCAAFDMLNFSPDDSTSASLKLDRAAIQLLNIPASP